MSLEKEWLLQCVASKSIYWSARAACELCNGKWLLAARPRRMAHGYNAAHRGGQAHTYSRTHHCGKAEVEVDELFVEVTHTAVLTMDDLFGDDVVESREDAGDGVVQRSVRFASHTSDGRQAVGDAATLDEGAATTSGGGVAAASQPVTLDDIFGDGDSDAADNVEYVASSADTLASSQVPDNDVVRDIAPQLLQHTQYVAESHAVGRTTLHLSTLLRPAPDARISSLRLPKLVATAPDAFDASSYNEEREDAALAAVGRLAAREALIRFRLKRDAQGVVVTDAEGRPTRESNAQVVEWSDGSLTLRIGEEVFALNTAGTGARDHSTLFARAIAAAPASTGSAARSGARASTTTSRRETVLEAQAPLTDRLLLRGLVGVTSTAPASALAARSTAAGGAISGGKRRKLVQIAVTEDPETARQRRIKADEDAARQLGAQRRRGDEALRAAQRGDAAMEAATSFDDDSKGSISIAGIKAGLARSSGAAQGARGGTLAERSKVVGASVDSNSESESDASSSSAASSSDDDDV